MYKIESEDYGFKLTFSGFIKENEMRSWIRDSKKILEDAPESFNLFVDMRTLNAISQESRLLIQEGQKYYRAKGMVRSVVIVDSLITKIQFRNMAIDTGIYEWERYVDISSTSDWENIALKWIVQKIDPDK